ncbi:MAG: hypothetical protein V4448_17535 [Pseudomonadota bacterium]
MKNIYLVAGGAVLAAVVYAYWKTSLPGVVKEGWEAAGILGGLGLDMITEPLDTFGISPGNNVYGVPKWQPTAPWWNPADVVSNNDSGINFNYF